MKNTIKRATQYDVAREAGVSLATVSYVVNNGPRPVADSTRIRVKEAIERLGYHPHGIAQSLRKGISNNVGLLVHSLIPTSSGYLVNEIEENLTRLGLNLILACSHEDCERESRMLDMLSSQSIDGLLIIPTDCSNEMKVNQLIKEGLPVVFIDRYIPDLSADVVMTDNIQAGRDATEYLIRDGCKRIMLISFSDTASSAIERMEGYKLALKNNNIQLDDELIRIIHYEVRDSTESKLAEFITNHDTPDGIVWSSDHFVVDIAHQLEQFGVPVPKQICISGGIFQSSWNRMFQLPMPVIDQNYRKIAATAVDYLHERISGKHDVRPRKTLIKADLYTRNR